MKKFLKEAGIVAGATLGAGIFALPYVFYESGLAAGIFYLLGLSAVVIVAHILYWRALAASGGRMGLLELAKTCLGEPGYYIGLLAIVGGLTLTLVVHLILGPRFISLLFPSLGATSGFFLFWIVSVLPLFLGTRRMLAAEILGTTLVAAIVFLIFFASGPGSPAPQAAADIKNLFLPFGAILFALAGWTAVEPVYDAGGKNKRTGPPVLSFVCGTLFVALLYFIFARGILGSASVISPDTVSGLSGWPSYKIIFLGALGVFSLWVSYLPISLEIKNSLLREGVNGRASLAFVVLAPLLLSVDGFRNFIEVIGLAGGVFLSAQYILIILVGEKSLRPSRLRRFFLNLALAAFALAIVYEIYHFVVK